MIVEFSVELTSLNRIILLILLALRRHVTRKDKYCGQVKIRAKSEHNTQYIFTNPHETEHKSGLTETDDRSNNWSEWSLIMHKIKNIVKSSNVLFAKYLYEM